MATLIETITSPRHRFEIMENNGKEYAIKFKLRGKKGTLLSYSNFRPYIKNFVEQEVQEKRVWDERLKQDKTDRAELFSSLQVNDVLQCNWGYSIDAVKFFKLIGKKGKSTLILQEIGSTLDAIDCMTGYATPDETVTKKSPITVKFGKYDGKTFAIKDLPCSHAWKYAGKPIWYNTAD